MERRKPTRIDWARLAAYIDADGCIGIARLCNKKGNRRYLYLSLQVVNTDPRLPDWCARLFGGKTYLARPQTSRWKGVVHWVVSCKQAATILEGCLPYFILKTEQAEICLAFQRTKGVREVGTHETPIEIVKFRNECKVKITELNRRGPKEDSAVSEVVN